MIKNPNEIVPVLIDALKTSLGDALKSVVMHGEAVSHEFVPGKSTVSLLVILDDISFGSIEKSSDVFSAWMKKGTMQPSMMTQGMLSEAVVLFPIELLGIQRSYRVLHGADPLENIVLCKDALLTQCRRELAGMLLHTSIGYMGNPSGKRYLENELKSMLKRVLPVFSALLVLYDKKIPHATTEIIAAVEDLYVLGPSVLSEVFLGRFKSTINDAYKEFYSILIQIHESLNRITIADEGNTDTDDELID